ATRGGDMQRSVVLAGVLAAVLGGGVWTVAASSLPVAEERASQPAQSELSPSLAQETPRSLTTMPVIGTNDETAGRVDAGTRNTDPRGLERVLRTTEGARLPLEVERVAAVDAQLRLGEPMSKDALRERIARFDPDKLTPVAVDTELAQLARPQRTG